MFKQLSASHERKMGKVLIFHDWQESLYTAQKQVDNTDESLN